jgi:hypothetical protein
MRVKKKGGRPKTREFIELQMEVEHCLRYCLKERDATVIDRLVDIRRRYISKVDISSSRHSQHWRKAVLAAVMSLGQGEEIADDIVEKSKKKLISKLEKRKDKHGYKARIWEKTASEETVARFD